MSKLTKGQKNEMKRQYFQKRVDAIKEHGYTIESHCLGDKRYADNWTYYLHKDGICVHPGGCYEYEFEAVELAEKIILETPIQTP